MLLSSFRKWYILSLSGLLLVALLGAIMRYKIEFELPLINQKNLQHAHSHFAFSGWVSQAIMVFMVFILNKYQQITSKKYDTLFVINFALALLMLISFAWSGYSVVSIICSTLSIIVSFAFSITFWNDTATNKVGKTVFFSWFRNGLIFNVISSFGTFILAYMMATNQVHQQTYLASIYWYLHFQYNGWFFFGIVGVFLSFFSFNQVHIKQLKIIKYLFVFSCYIGYLLSVLWWKLPASLFILSILASLVQVFAWLFFVKIIWSNYAQFQHQPRPLKLIMLILFFAVSVKIGLQAASNIPALSELAFGLRSVVIAYLHLVLLAITSVFLLVAPLLLNMFNSTSSLTKILLAVVSIIYLNQLVLGAQAISAIYYLSIPGIQVALLAIALIILALITVLITRYQASIKQ